MGRQTLRKQLGIGSRKRTASRVIPKKICKTNQSVAERHFYKRLSLIISSNFRYQPFLAVSRKIGPKVPVANDILGSHEKEIYPTTSCDENCIEFEFQTDRNKNVVLRDLLGFEIEISQRSWLRNLQYQRSRKRTETKNKSGWESDCGGGARGSSSSRYSCK